MADPTTNYGWDKPINGADLDTWGIKLRTFMDDLDTDLKAVEDAVDEKQDESAILTSLAGTAGTSGTFPYFSGASAFSLSAISSQGRDFLTDTTAAAQRSRIGLGNVGNYHITVSTSGPSGGADGDVWCLVP